MNEFRDELIFTVDFNNVADDGRLVKGALARVDGVVVPREGDYVILQDPEGNRCRAWIARIQGPLAYFDLDESTWVSGEDMHPAGIPTPRQRLDFVGSDR